MDSLSGDRFLQEQVTLPALEQHLATAMGIIQSSGSIDSSAVCVLPSSRSWGDPHGSRGELEVPEEIIQLMVELLQPTNGMRIYDPACGTGSLLLGFLGTMYLTHLTREVYALNPEEGRYVSLAGLSAFNSYVPHIVMIIKGYYDCSGQKESKYFTLAGLVAGIDVWKKFEDCWNGVLCAHKCGRLHMKHATRCHDSFRGWKEEQVRRLLRDLINNCISPATWWGEEYSSSLYSAYCTIEREEYKKAKLRFPLLKDKATICAEYMAEVALRRLPQDPSKPEGHRLGAVEMYFDRNEPFEPSLRSIWNSALNRPSGQRGPLSLIAQIEPVNDFKPPGLQAADFLAWHVNRWQTKRIEDPDESIRANLMAVLSSSGVGDLLTYEKLISWPGYCQTEEDQGDGSRLAGFQVPPASPA